MGVAGKVSWAGLMTGSGDNRTTSEFCGGGCAAVGSLGLLVAGLGDGSDFCAGLKLVEADLRLTKLVVISTRGAVAAWCGGLSSCSS